MRSWQKILLITASALFLLFFAAAVILPEVIKTKAIEQLRVDYNRELRIERIIINLFNLEVDIRKLDLKEPGANQTFVSFDRLKFSLSLRSVLDRALIIDDLTLERPFVRLEKLSAERFNFSDFIPAAPAQKPAEADAPFLFSFNNLQLRDGNLIFSDRSDQLDLVHRIDELNLAIPFVGNIPYLVDRYIQPALSLRFDDSPVVASGQMKPFADSVETRLELNLRNIDLPFYAAYLKPFVPFELTDGSLSTQLELSYRVSNDKKPILLLGGDLSLSTLRLERDGQTFFFLPLLLVQVERLNPFAGEYRFDNISLYAPQLRVERDADGRINLLGLLPAASSPEKEPAPAAEAGDAATPPLLSVGTLRLREGRVDFSDAVPPGGFSSRIAEINLLVHDLSTREAPPAPFHFALKTDHGERLKIDGTLSLTPVACSGHLQLQGLPLGAYSPYLQPYLTRTPTGTAGLETAFALTKTEQSLTGLQFSLADLRQGLSETDSFGLGALRIKDARVRLPQRQVEVGGLSMEGGRLVLSRDAQGELPFAHLVKPRPEPPPSDVQAEAQPPAATAEQPQWSVKLAGLRIQDFAARFTDGTAPRPSPVEIEHLDLQLADLHWPAAVESAWQLAGDWGGGGHFSAAGDLVHTPLQLGGSFKTEQLDLRPLNSYIPRDLWLNLASAKLDSALVFDLRQGERLEGQIKGEVGLRGFSLAGIDDELLRWESLQFEELQVDLNPLALAVARVSLNNYLARIRVAPDGRINLNQIQAPRPPEAEEPAAPAPSAQVVRQEAPALPSIRVDELTLQGGELSFVDHHLPQLFTSTMYELGGRISGLSSTPGQSASVDLRGALENHSPLTISGRIAPLAGDLETDLRVRFNEIDLAPATPYSGTYLGYVIDKGKLYLDLAYKIKGRRVQASNKIFLDQFTFGKAVASEAATGLPVRLAVALLKDRKGEIHLDLPVSGNTDDPEFGIFSTVVTLLRNLLVKAATAPFCLLAAMLGGGGEDFSQLAFAPGVANLTPADREKLGQLNNMLVERPALKLALSGFIDPAQDPEGYRKEQLRQAVTAEWHKQIAPQVGREMTADEYLDNLVKVYGRAKFPKPRNALGMLKKLPAAEMEKLLLAHMIVGAEELAQLAKAREAAVKAELLRQNPDLGPRIFLKAAEITAPAEKDQARARVEFGVAVE